MYIYIYLPIYTSLSLSLSLSPHGSIYRSLYLSFCIPHYFQSLKVERFSPSTKPFDMRTVQSGAPDGCIETLNPKPCPAQTAFLR